MNKIVALLAAGMAVAAFAENEVEKYDSRMRIDDSSAKITDGVKWIDGKLIPIEGRAYDDVDNYYDRLPKEMSTNINWGVHAMKHHTSGMLFRFKTDSSTLHFRWTPWNESINMDHMAGTGVAGIDVYRRDPQTGKWRYKETGRIRDAKKGGSLTTWWPRGSECIVNLPLYNGIREFQIGIDTNASIMAVGPRTSGVEKPVVFYGTSITHGGCASRPGMGFVNMVGRDLDVPVVGLGFSGSGVMEYELSDILARIDASCYVLDCLWNMCSDPSAKKDRSVERNYEPFIRNLRAKRPDVPIIMAEACDVNFSGRKSDKDIYTKKLYDKLIAEGWKNLIYLPKDNMYSGDGEGTVDGCHPNDLGMKSLAVAFGGAVKEALKLK